jgi:hypothetical protein
MDRDGTPNPSSVLNAPLLDASGKWRVLSRLEVHRAPVRATIQ